MTSAEQRRAAVHAICDDLAGNCDVAEEILAPIRGWADALVRPRGVVLLDQLASCARTAIDDPHGLADTERDWRGAHPAESAQAAASYAIEKCDAIIQALNPGDESVEGYALTLRTINAHLQERADSLKRAGPELADGKQRRFLSVEWRVRQAVHELELAIRLLESVQPS